MRRIAPVIIVIALIATTAIILQFVTSRDTTAGVQGNGRSQTPATSADGRLVAFGSIASNLVPGDTNGAADVFVRDRQLGVTTLVSVGVNNTQANGESFGPSISGDRRFVVFSSDASNLVPDDTNEAFDVFVRDLELGVTERISVGPGGVQADARSFRAEISTNGHFVTFTSQASNLVPGDTNGRVDIFLYDRMRGATERISVSGDGTEANGDSVGSSLSADGRFVAFASSASNLVAGDTNNRNDVFVRDWMLGTTERVNVGSDGSQTQDNSIGWSISADGRFVGFGSQAPNLVPGDTNGVVDVFLRDRMLETTQRISVSSDGTQADQPSHAVPLINANGRIIGFSAQATNLVPNDTNAWFDMFVRDVTSGVTTRISVSSDGVEGNGESSTDSIGSGISADGNLVTFTSAASNLVANDTNNTADVFLHDVRSGTTERISVGSS
jgi:Tol biopolymer transport system component